MTPKERAIQLVRGGRSYSEAGEAVGATRNQVAGWCWRAGVKAPLTESKWERGKQKIAAKAWLRWSRMSDEERHEHAMKVWAGRRRMEAHQ